MRFLHYIEKSLSTTIAPMVFVMMFVNVVIGVFFATGIFMTGHESVLYSAGVLIHRQIWGLAS